MWDWWLVAGAVSSDRLERHGRPGSDCRIQAYDLFYSDPTDLSWDAGDDVIRRSNGMCTARTTLLGMADACVTAERRQPTMFVMVGLPAAGKTSRARQLAEERCALRLTPDEWMIPLFGQQQPEGKRNVLEGRLIWIALQALTVGVDVIIDFGVWAKHERSALRALASSVGAASELVYLQVDEAEQWRRVQARSLTDTATTFEITKAELEDWTKIFQPPDADELNTTHVDAPPQGFDSWATWAAQWWPTSLPPHSPRHDSPPSCPTST